MENLNLQTIARAMNETLQSGDLVTPLDVNGCTPGAKVRNAYRLGVELAAERLASALELTQEQRVAFRTACGLNRQAANCVSVAGGWRSADAAGDQFGPTFNAIADLWDWQRANAGRAN